MISVVIPLYNKAHTIVNTLTTVMNQTYKDFEVIIVNDGSTDNGVDLIKSNFNDSRIRIINQKNSGVSAARNCGIEEAKGNWIAFLDADDECSDGMIEKQLRCLQNYGTSDSIAFSTLKIVYVDGKKSDTIRLIDKDYAPAIELLISMWKYNQWNCPHCHLIHRSLFEKTTGWNEKLLKNQDGEFFARIYAIDDKAIFEPEEYAIWNREYSGTISNNHSEEAELSVVESYKIITNLILDYCNNQNNRTICAKHIGILLYDLYPKKKIASQRIIDVLNQYNLPILLPTRNITKIIEYLFGWKISVSFQKLFRVLFK